MPAVVITGEKGIDAVGCKASLSISTRILLFIFIVRRLRKQGYLGLI